MQRCTSQSFLVPKQEIADHDYDLSINKYKKTIAKVIEYPPTSEIIADIFAIEERIAIELKELEAMLDD